MGIQKFLFAVPFLFIFSKSYGQDTIQTEKNTELLSAVSGNTKMLLTGVAWFGFLYHINNTDKTIPKTTFNDFGFSPMFLWKLSDKFFFESEIEIQNDGTSDNSAAFDLEYAKLSFRLNKYMTIGAGKMLSPFGAYNERWEPNHIEKFPNAPLRPDDGVLPDDTHLFWGSVMGVDVRGGVPLGSAKMNYSLYISNGPKLHLEKEMGGLLQYENWNDNNSNKEVGGRIGFLPFPNSSLEFGFSGKYGIAGNQGDSLYNKIGATAYAVDFSYVKSIDAIRSIINIRGQFNSVTVGKANYQLTDSTTYTFDNAMQSYFTQFSIRPGMAGNKYLKKTEFLLRYSDVTPPKDAVWSPKDTNGQGGSIKRIDIGLCYWVTWRTGLRIAYEISTMPDGAHPKELVVRFATGF
jgi:hypothetical protein